MAKSAILGSRITKDDFETNYLVINHQIKIVFLHIESEARLKKLTLMIKEAAEFAASIGCDEGCLDLKEIAAKVLNYRRLE